MRAISKVGFFIGLAMLADIVWDFVRFTLPTSSAFPRLLSGYMRLLTKYDGGLRVMTVLLGIVLVGQLVLIRLATKNDESRPAAPMHSSPDASSQRKKSARSMSEDAFPVGVGLLAFVAWGVWLEVNLHLVERALHPANITVGLLYRWYFQGTLRPVIVILGILLVGQLPIAWLLSKPHQGRREAPREPILAPAAGLAQPDAALEILKERLACGHINVQEYERIRAALKEE
jgi:uncharacterized membrane protein